MSSDGKKTAHSLITDFAYGDFDFTQLLIEFERLPMSAPAHLQKKNRSWAEIYRDAEDGDDTDVPEAIVSGEHSGKLTKAQAKRLSEIYRRKVPR